MMPFILSVVHPFRGASTTPQTPPGTAGRAAEIGRRPEPTSHNQATEAVKGAEPIGTVYGGDMACSLTQTPVPDPDAWRASAERRSGTWWEHGSNWIDERSADEQKAPARLGSRRHKVIDPARGSYVRRIEPVAA